jgi:hypothetical protein
MAFVHAMNSAFQPTKKGANGADVYTEEGVGDERVSLFTMLNRGLDEKYIHDSITNYVHRIPPVDAICDLFVMAFQTRDIRGGKGERKLFHFMIKTLYSLYPEITLKMLHLIPEYGCWRDMWELYTMVPGLRNCILGIVKMQFMSDLVVADSDKKSSMSLLAKWLPREKSSTYPGLAHAIASALYPNESAVRKRLVRYRKETSYMNAILKTVETYMCGGRWRKIKPEHVPGRCLKLHDRAFLNETSRGQLRYPDSTDRMKCRVHFEEFAQDLESGKKKAHGADVIMPHELLKKIIRETHITDTQHMINQGQWNAIRQQTEALGGLGKSVAMCDFSGSMGGLPLEISMAIGILISECTHFAFKNSILTFDQHPLWHTFFDLDSLKQKVESLSGVGQGLNTDFYKACRLILDRMIAFKVPPEEAPEDLIVITDMGFDNASNSHQYGSYSRMGSWQTQIQRIRTEFQEEGEKLWGKAWKAPRIVIWNVSARYKDFHAKAHDEGVVQLSGWSPNILTALQNNGVQTQTPYEGMRAALDRERYDPVRDVWQQYHNWGRSGMEHDELP